MVAEDTNPGQSQRQNNHLLARVGDVPPRAGESEGVSPRLHQLEVSQAQPRSIMRGLGSEDT